MARRTSLHRKAEYICADLSSRPNFPLQSHGGPYILVTYAHFVRQWSMQTIQRSLKPLHRPVLVRLTPDDWLLWRSLRLQALTEAPYAFGSKLAEWQGVGDQEARWRERLASVSLNLIAVLNDCPLGMVSATQPDQSGNAELISLWVSPAGRGFGVGDALIEAVVQWAMKQEVRRISLDVTDGNQHATRLYLRHGFVQTGLAPFSPPEQPEYRLVKILGLQ